MPRYDGGAAGRPDGLTAAWAVLIDDVGQTGPENMRRDEALLDDAVRLGNAFLRLYRWNPPTLSVGRNQPIPFEGVPIVRRPTGGQAVWHEHEVTYAVAAPIALYGSLRNAYCRIHTSIAAALRLLGVDAVLAPAVRPSGRPVACFAAPVGGEIVVNGKKLVGSAQVRRGNAFLQHGSILLAGVQPCSTGGETTLAAVLGRTVGFDEVVNAVTAAWGVAPVAAG
jgi:lipoate-protein ligase A